MDESMVIDQTKNWIEKVVIGCNFCPFARPVYTRNQIRYTVTASQRKDLILDQLIAECRYLDGHPEVSTSLLILPELKVPFTEYWELVLSAEALLEKEDYEGIYQVASFHPDYQFEGEASGDPANYTNRSPFPMLHLLREEQLSEVLDEFPNPEEIPLRNIEFARKKGIAFFQSILKK